MYPTCPLHYAPQGDAPAGGIQSRDSITLNESPRQARADTIAPVHEPSTPR